MGVHSKIGVDRFPKQSTDVGTLARVTFHYDTSRDLRGTIIRSDAEDPWRTIIRLDDGRVVLSTECQYTPESLMLPEVRDLMRAME